jgi:hypothetical protein
MIRSATLLSAMLLASAPVAAQGTAGPSRSYCNNAIAATAFGRPEFEGGQSVYRYVAVITGPGLGVGRSRSVTIQFTPPSGTVPATTTSTTVSGTGNVQVNLASQALNFLQPPKTVPANEVINYVSITC